VVRAALPKADMRHQVLKRPLVVEDGIGHPLGRHFRHRRFEARTPLAHPLEQFCFRHGVLSPLIGRSRLIYIRV
jgi:hypothetical protein